MKITFQLLGIVLVLWCIKVVFAGETIASPQKQPLQPGLVQLTSQEIVHNSYCTVWQFKIDIPQGSPPAILSCEYRWKDQVSHGGGSGFGSTKDQAQQVKCTVVAQTGTVPNSHDRILLLNVHLGDRISSDVIRIGPNDQLNDLLKLTPKSDTYRLDEKVKIGELGGETFSVWVSSKLPTNEK